MDIVILGVRFIWKILVSYTYHQDTKVVYMSARLLLLLFFFIFLALIFVKIGYRYEILTTIRFNNIHCIVYVIYIYRCTSKIQRMILNYIFKCAILLTMGLKMNVDNNKGFPQLTLICAKPLYLNYTK